MTMPRFTIVIPTRDRAHTLAHTLRTCLAQDFADYEIVVADNCSSDPIQGVVNSCADNRIRYVRAPSLLAMSDSWEFALAQAAGEFILLLGNDDGLLLHALAEIDRLLRMLDARVLRWDSVCYHWPDLPLTEHAAPDALVVPLRQKDGYYAIERRDSKAMMKAAANARISYAELPMVYCSAIERRLLDQVRTESGRVFRSRSLDVYSSFALAHFAKTYYSVAAPMSINGLSGKSNGVACLYLNGASPVADEFRRLNSAAHHERHPLAPDVFVMPAGVADSFLQARDLLFPDDAELTLDRKQLAHNCIAAARLADDAAWRDFRAALRRSMSDDAELTAWFDAEYGNRSHDALPKPTQAHPRYNGDCLHLNAAEFGVSNVYEAAELCEKLLGGRRDGLNCHFAPIYPSTTLLPAVDPPREAEQREQPAGAATSVDALQWVELALSRLLSTLAPTRAMIDVGAHIGTSLAPFLHAGWDVVAFEPLEANRRTLADHFAGAERLSIRAEAVSNESGTRDFHLALNLDGSLHEYHHSLEQIGEDAWHRKGPTISVPAVRLDDLIALGEIPKRVGFLKIDTEGHDLAVLQGAAHLRCDAVSVEFWGDEHALGKSPSPATAMVELMHERGYRSFLVIRHDGDGVEVEDSSLAGIRPDSWGNIVFFNDDAVGLYERVVRDANWRLVLEMSGECTRLRGDLRAKEAVIRELDAAVHPNEPIVQALQQELAEKERVLHELDRAVRAREESIAELQDALNRSAATAAERLGAIEELRDKLDHLPRTVLAKIARTLAGVIRPSGRRDDAA